MTALYCVPKIQKVLCTVNLRGYAIGLPSLVCFTKCGMTWCAFVVFQMRNKVKFQVIVSEQLTKKSETWKRLLFVPI